METLEKQALAIFLPKGVFEWFDIVHSKVGEEDIQLVLEEKNIPPVTEAHKDKKVVPKSFTEITITDFPIRGKRALLTFKRRYWKVEGEDNYLKRDIKLSFPGTQLESEFALFLKEDGGRSSGLANFYRKVSLPPSQGV